MKYTGVVRRIDELGRIVIPKEIRKNLAIRDGENLEILIEDNKIIMKKFSNLENFEDIIKEIINDLYSSFNINISFYDRDKLIYTTDTKNIDFLEEFNDVIMNRKEEIIEVNEDKYFIKPLIIESNVVGILLLNLNNNLEEIVKLSNYLSHTILKKIDIS